MSTVSAATYIVGYLVPAAAFAFVLADDIFKKPKIAHGIASWFFFAAVMLQVFAVVCDIVLR